MRYYLDTEFNGMGGGLISLALVAESGDRSLQLFTIPTKPRPWIVRNVLPHLREGDGATEVAVDGFAGPIFEFLRDDDDPTLVCNWPDDARHVLQVMKRSGDLLDLPIIRFEIVCVPTSIANLPGAIRHNAWWDAMALRSAVLVKRTANRTDVIDPRR